MDLDLDSITEIYDNSVFYIEQMPKRSFEKERHVQVDITVEMNLDHVTLARSRYTILDLLADVGGIQSMIVSGLALLLSYWNYNHFDNTLVSQLFKVKDRQPRFDNKDSTSLKDVESTRVQQGSLGTPIKSVTCFNIVELLIDCIPVRLRCKFFRKSRQMRVMEKARDVLAQEANIMSIIKSQRLFSHALKLLLTQA